MTDVHERERRGPACWLWLNRPQVRNALDDQLAGALRSAFEAIEQDDEVRVVVVAGRGSAFCAGGDLARMKQAAAMPADEARRDALRFAELLYRIHTFPKPVIARVHGAAFAGGMGLVAACDIAVVAEDAEFCLPEVKIGLVPAMISPYLVRAMGEREARRYALSAERFSGQEAHRIGLAHECVPQEELDSRVEHLCSELAAAGPQALSRCKAMLEKVSDAALTPELAVETAAVLADVRAGEEAREGIASFLERRKPAWVRSE